MKTLLTLILVSFSPPAHADLTQDLAQIRALLPAGSDVARIQAARLRGGSEREADEAGAVNYLIRDFNNDGREDILVISEVNPTLVSYEDNKPCETYDYSRCYIEYKQ